MWRWAGLCILAALVGDCAGDDPPPITPPPVEIAAPFESPPPEPAAPAEQVAELEARIAGLEEENAALRKDLREMGMQALEWRAQLFEHEREKAGRPTASTPDPLRIVASSARTTEVNQSWHRKAWQVTVRNDTRIRQSFDLQVRFVDREGFTIAEDIQYNLEVATYQEETFYGDKLVGLPEAKRVAAFDPKIIR